MSLPSLIGVSLRRGLRLAILCALGVVLLALPYLTRARFQSAEATEKTKRRQSNSIPGEILVRFRENSAPTKTGARTELLVGQGVAQILINLEQFSGSEVVSGLRLARVAAT